MLENGINGVILIIILGIVILMVLVVSGMSYNGFGECINKYLANV
jgi:type II secretory pathway component PulK